MVAIFIDLFYSKPYLLYFDLQQANNYPECNSSYCTDVLWMQYIYCENQQLRSNWLHVTLTVKNGGKDQRCPVQIVKNRRVMDSARWTPASRTSAGRKKIVSSKKKLKSFLFL